MAFVTGALLIDAPASALNNARDAVGAVYDNEVGVKMIRTREGGYPYVSAQAFRYWLRETLLEDPEWGKHISPIFRESKIAYTDANPILYWDDDLLGYMRAPSKRADAVKARQADVKAAQATETRESVTRISPLRTSTLVSIAPVGAVNDFGTMTRSDGDPVPHSHQFYRTVMKGLFSLDLRMAGTFFYRKKSGYQNLDEVRIAQAEEQNLTKLEELEAFQLNLDERKRRVSHLLRGLGKLQGGAKQALHYTDVTPAAVLAAVTTGGNNPMHYVVGADAKGLPQVNTGALKEMLDVWGDQLISDIYVGWAQGFHDRQREVLLEALGREGLAVESLPNSKTEDTQEASSEAQRATENRGKSKVLVGHPRQVFGHLADSIQGEDGSRWLS